MHAADFLIDIIIVLLVISAATLLDHANEHPHADHRAEPVERRPPADDTKGFTLAVIAAQRRALPDARDRNLHRGRSERRPGGPRRRSDQPQIKRCAAGLRVIFSVATAMRRTLQERA